LTDPVTVFFVSGRAVATEWPNFSWDDAGFMAAPSSLQERNGAACGEVGDVTTLKHVLLLVEEMPFIHNCLTNETFFN